MPKLSEATVASITVPAGKRDVLVFDQGLPGFGVRKYASGRTVYFVKYEIHGQQRKITLGPYARGILADMRRRAADVLAKARLGEDVSAQRQASKRKGAATFIDLIPLFLEAKQEEIADSYRAALDRYLRRHIQALHNVPIEVITRRDVVIEIDRIAVQHGKVAADRAKAALSGFFAWCIERSYLDLSPVQSIKRRATNGSRDRVLSEAELICIWRACTDDDYGRILQLLILTGQRKSEIGNLSWAEIDFERLQIELPGSRTKNKRSHLVPLSNQAIAILRTIMRRLDRDLLFGLGTGGFSGWSKSKERLDARLPANIASWTVHDIRRSVVTHMGERGFAEPHVIEAIVNHVSGTKAGVAGIYNRAAYANEKRRALTLWAEHIGALITKA